MKFSPEIVELRAVMVIPVVFDRARLAGFSGGVVGVAVGGALDFARDTGRVPLPCATAPPHFQVH